MVVTSESNSDCFEIPRTREAMRSSSPLKRKHEDDNVCTKKKTFVSSSPANRIWTKTDELVILGGTVDYENEKGLSYGSDLDAFYRYIKDSIGAHFTKQQVINKMMNMKKKFRYNQARSSHDDDDEISKLSMIIWGTKNETEGALQEVLVSYKDVPCERVSNGEKEKEKSEEDGVDEFCVLQNALEEAALFQSLGRNQQKLLLQNLKRLEAETRKELTGEWEALLPEEVQLKIKKQAFSANLANPPRRVSA